ncbi:MAG: Crp/Fnr family transcriptional regulator [Thermoanaerobaculia bacterium]
MELLSRMMDGSISYDPRDRLEPVLSGFGDRAADKINFEEIPILEGCSQTQLRSIARIARVLDAAAGTVLVRRGEPGDEFFLILDGTLTVEVSRERSVPLGPGAFFGEMSLLDGGTRSATVVSETPVRLLVINRENFSVLCREVPDLTQILSATLSRRLRQAEQRTERVGGSPARL